MRSRSTTPNNAHLLAPASVELMTSNHVPQALTYQALVDPSK